MGETHDTTADRLTFWRGWYEGARRYPDSQRLAIYDAIMAFAFDGVEPAEPAGDITAAIVYQTIATIRPTIAISRKRRQFGAIGGKQTPSKTEANAKQNITTVKANAKQKRKTRKQVKEQEQVQEQEHIAISSAATRETQQPTLDQFLAGAVLAGVPEDFARDFYAGLVAAGWRDADGLYVANWRRYLKSAWVDEQKKISAARAESGASDELMKGLRRARA